MLVISCALHWRPYYATEASANSSVSAVKGNSSCPKCATNKASKPSCCARGGAWFKKCGDVGDIHFDHTWAEGIQACKAFATLFSVKSRLKAKTRRVGDFVFPRNTDQPRNASQHQTNIYHASSMMSHAVIKHSEDFFGVATVVTCIFVSFIVSKLQT